MRNYQTKPKNRLFLWILLAFVAVLAVVVFFCVMHVRGLLIEYESRQPDRQVEFVLEELKKKAQNEEDFINTFNIGELTACEYEEGTDILGDYLELFADPKTEFAVKPGGVAEDEMKYVIRCGDTELAEVLLKATSPLETKLAVFSMRDWKVTEVIAGPTAKDYSLTLPSDFSLTVNGMSCNDGTSLDGGEVSYTLNGFFLEPRLEISDPDGRIAEYVIRGGRILPEIYDYSMVLPKSIAVTLDSLPCVGTERDDGYMVYSIRQLDKPEVVISDLYGNSVTYEGGSLEMTQLTVLCDENYKVSVNSAPVPEDAIYRTVPKKYKIIEDTVDNLPMNMEYDIAVLKEGAVISVTDPDGNSVVLPEGEKLLDLTTVNGSDTIPAEIENSIDVLTVAKKWSLYMSNDCSFGEISAYMLPDSYQYEVAYKYSTSVDRTFFSGHVLLDPTFTDTSVGNYVQITEDCFSVDISLVKHMRLNSAQNVDDAMNDRFYFVRSNGKWLLAGMQEVTDNA